MDVDVCKKETRLSQVKYNTVFVIINKLCDKDSNNW